MHREIAADAVAGAVLVIDAGLPEKLPRQRVELRAGGAVGNETSFNAPVSRRKVSSASTVSISVSTPLGASRSIHARNRASATASRRCALRVPSAAAEGNREHDKRRGQPKP